MNYIKRDLESIIFKSFESPYVSALLGPRRVGKSTLVNAYMDLHQTRVWAVLNMDALLERQRCARGELQNLIQEKALTRIGAQDIWVAIDEAQKCPELFEQIKIIYDQFKHHHYKIKFILTGSGSLSLHRLSVETLAGRIEILYLREFSLNELAKFKNAISNIGDEHKHILELANADPSKIKEAVNARMPFKACLESALQHILLWGGLPEIAIETAQDKILGYLANYLQTYLEKDVRAVQEITQLNTYQQLLESIAVQTGSIRDDKKILESLGCSRETLKKYRGYLAATLVYQEIYPFIASHLKRLTKSPKGYLVNNGLISFLTGLYDFKALEKTGLIGHRFENWFLQALQLWLDSTPGRNLIYYWRTSSGIEVDFVLDKKPIVLPFEVTFSSKINERKVKNLKKFLATETRAPQGFYIYNGEYIYNAEDKIHFLPAWVIG